MIVRRKLWQDMLLESRKHVAEFGNDADGFRYNYGLKKEYLFKYLSKDTSILFLNHDEETYDFIVHCYERQAQCIPYLIDVLSLLLLRPFMSATSTNAICNRGRMFVLSMKQLRELIGLESPHRLDRLLDIGAGDGFVTEKIAPIFNHVEVTEVNRFMLWRLQSHKGWRIHDTVSWLATMHNYSMITCFNVLDRCDKPWTMLKNMKDKLECGGLLVIALVLPYTPYIDDHGSFGRQPKGVERLSIHGSSIEENIVAFKDNIVVPLGLTLKAVAKVPYLCEGSHVRPFYVLDDVVFVLQKE
eukprot:m.6853 g.6853  ORF g.6853 m.6853 type:complete len:300 (+) comp2664_c0_seq1:62-961(+)